MSHKRRSKRRKKNTDAGGATVELNVMPFIDIFSLLTTFLLFSAVFVQIGVLEVQVPFLSNAAPPEEPDKPTRTISVKVDLSKDSIEVSTVWSEDPKNPKSYKFEHTELGIEEMHAKLLELRLANPESDKLTFYVDDEITYNEMASVLDGIKLLAEGDPPVQQVVKKSEEGIEAETVAQSQFLYMKVIMGSVML